MVCRVISRINDHNIDKICCFIGGSSVAWASSLFAGGLRGWGPSVLLVEGVMMVAIPVIRTWAANRTGAVHPINDTASNHRSFTTVTNPLPSTVGSRTARATRVALLNQEPAGSSPGLAFTDVRTV
jgi:hypothetical protein